MRRSPIMMMALCFAGCDGSDKDGPLVDSAPIEVEGFCTDYTAEADSVSLEEGNEGATSGQVQGRLIQGVVADPSDPRFVSFVDYIMDNLDVGGQPTVGRTDADGYFTETLGAGNWHIKTSGHQGSYYCAADLDFTVISGRITRLCVDMNCQ
ncbi:MAG: hypothetical protein H6739_20575 [Alphaproteobacteria bacterium]|nr:hypothetical protein [Alphaproteobacteria bacterium]